VPRSKEVVVMVADAPELLAEGREKEKQGNPEFL
jgi:hypothetical protein